MEFHVGGQAQGEGGTDPQFAFSRQVSPHRQNQTVGDANINALAPNPLDDRVSSAASAEPLNRFSRTWADTRTGVLHDESQPIHFSHRFPAHFKRCLAVFSVL